MVAAFLLVYIKMSFKRHYTLKNLPTSEENCVLYFKYPWKFPGKGVKKVLEKPGFLKLGRYTNPEYQ